LLVAIDTIGDGERHPLPQQHDAVEKNPLRPNFCFIKLGVDVVVIEEKFLFRNSI